MTKPAVILVLTVATVGSSGLAARAEDPLFSRVSTGTVFSTPSEGSGGSGNAGGSEAPGARLERAEKVLKISQLADLLRDAGLEPETNSDETVTTVKLQHSRWTFPVALALSEDLQRLQIVLLLSELKEKKLPAEKLLALFSANRDFQPVTFVFSGQTQRLELLVGVENVRISPSLLRAELRRLATVAEQTASLWELEATPAPSAQPQQGTTTPAPQQVATAPQATAPAATPPPANTSAPAAPQAAPAPAQPQAQPASSLVGRWSATRSAKEAFAIALKADGSFVLVHVKDGKQNRSTGSFTLSGGQLTLAISSGGKLTAAISNQTASSFDFTPASGAKLTFKKA